MSVPLQWTTGLRHRMTSLREQTILDQSKSCGWQPIIGNNKDNYCIYLSGITIPPSKFQTKWWPFSTKIQKHRGNQREFLCLVGRLSAMIHFLYIFRRQLWQGQSGHSTCTWLALHGTGWWESGIHQRFIKSQWEHAFCILWWTVLTPVCFWCTSLKMLLCHPDVHSLCFLCLPVVTLGGSWVHVSPRSSIPSLSDKQRIWRARANGLQQINQGTVASFGYGSKLGTPIIGWLILN